MTAEHKNLDYLKGKFEDGDRPTGEDFAHLIDSCHNTRQLTDVTITASLSVQDTLTVDGKINTRDVAADGSKLDTLDSFVRSNSDSWEETDHILSVSSTIETVSSVLSNNIYTLNNTLSTYIDDNISAVDSKIDDNISAVDSKIDDNISAVDSKIDLNVTQLTSSINNNINTIDTNADNINTRVDNINIELDELEVDVGALNTTVADNSASWGVDENTNTLGGLVDVVTTGAEHNSVLKYDTTEQLWLPATDLHGEGQHVDTFLELHDTPVAFTGSDEFIKVNQSGDGIAFVSHETQVWDDVSNVVTTNSASWAEQTDVSDLTNVVTTNSASWAEQTDVSDLTTVVSTNSASWAEQTDVSDLTTVVSTNSASWAEQTDVSDLTNVVTTNSASWAEQTDVSGLVSDIADVTTAVSSNSSNWAEQTDVSGLVSDIADVTNVVTTNSASWAEQTDVSDLTNVVTTNSANWAEQTDVSDLTNVVTTNSASWAEQTDVSGLVSDIADVTTAVSSNSSNWAVLNSQGKLVESQIPELSITQTYTVQNKEEVTTLNPAEGIQRGDIVIVSTAYDNLIAKVDNPSGVYDQSTKTYSGYSKLSRPDAYVTSVNEMYGNVVIETDSITDQDNTNKWSTADKNTYINTLSSNFINTTTGIYTSAGAELHDIFSTSDNIIGDQVVTGESTATFYTGKYKTKDNSGSTLTGITRDVNIGGHVLHIVNGIITGITDE